MPAVILTIELEQTGPVPGLARSFARLRKQVLTDAALYWHAELFPAHFGPANRARYQHVPRTPLYVQEIKPATGKGQGKYVDNVLSGQSQRFLQAFVTARGTQNQMTLTMKGPRYFAQPFVGSYRDPQTGKTKRITRQPDKVAEATRVDRRDALLISEFAAERLEKLIGEARQQKVTTIRG